MLLTAYRLSGDAQPAQSLDEAAQELHVGWSRYPRRRPNSRRTRQPWSRRSSRCCCAPARSRPNARAQEPLEEHGTALHQQPVQRLLDGLAHLVGEVEHEHRVVGARRYRGRRWGSARRTRSSTSTGSGTSPSGPEPRERRGHREVRQAEQPGHDPEVPEHRVDLLGPDDRARHDRHPGSDRRRRRSHLGRSAAAGSARRRACRCPCSPRATRRPARPWRAAARRRAWRRACDPLLRASSPTNGSPNTRSAPSIRRWRRAGCWSRIASWIMSAVERDRAGVVGDDQRRPVGRDVVEPA